MATSEGDREKRIRVLTEKMIPIYEERVNTTFTTLAKLKGNIEAALGQIEYFKDSHRNLQEIRDILYEGMNKYHGASKEFSDFLGDQNTRESLQEQIVVNTLYREIDNKVKAEIRQIDLILTSTRSERQVNKLSLPPVKEEVQTDQQAELVNQNNDNTSEMNYVHESTHSQQSEQKSRSSGRSRSSSQSSRKHGSHSNSSSDYSHSSRSIILERKTKLEVAKTRFSIIQQEEKIKQQQNDIEAKAKEEKAASEAKLEKQRFEFNSTLNILKHQRELMEAEAEFSAAKEILQDQALSDTSLDLPEESSHEKSEKYVLDISQQIQQQDTSKLKSTSYSNDVVNPGKKYSSVQESPESDSKFFIRPQKSEPAFLRDSRDVPERNHIGCQILNPKVNEFIPQSAKGKEINNNDMLFAKPNYSSVSTHEKNKTETTSELTKYIMKKDLLLNRLSQFDDKAERYLSWKNSFRNIISELETTSTEELDLLLRWLGPQSRRQASSLRTAYAHNETEGLCKIWRRLDERYGAPEKVAASLKERLDKFQRMTSNDVDRFYELSDLLLEIQSVKENPQYSMVLSYFDSSIGVNIIVSKLPNFVQNKWIDHASKYKIANSVMYPPFPVFVQFIHDMAVRLNDPSFQIKQTSDTRNDFPSIRKERRNELKFNNSAKQLNTRVTAIKTDIDNKGTKFRTCPLHEEGKHELANCRKFLEKPLEEKRALIQKHGICFKCLKDKHLAKHCKENIKCEKCQSSKHSTAFHIVCSQPDKDYGGERSKAPVETKCTQICGDNGNEKPYRGKSCAKTLLVQVYPVGKPELSLRTYVTIDEQSNRSLARSEFFDHFGEKSEYINYTLMSCSGKTACSGRLASGYVLESLDSDVQLNCPPLLECNEIPNSKHEIATPAVARQYTHLQDLDRLIPELDLNSDILILIGRDMMPAHHVLDQRIGKDNEPYGQKLRLGWAIIGESCVGLVHASEIVTVNKTSILSNGRESHLEPCEYGFKVKDNIEQDFNSIFQRTPEDDTPGFSQDDKVFLSIMDKEFVKAESGRLSAPLPFRKDRQNLPNNYIQAKQRAENLTRNLKRNKVKQTHFIEFMEKIFSNNHAEEAPPRMEGQELWYLPIFGVYSAKKPSKIRVVFDSSAQHDGICLNDILLKGPDLTNNLVGVLLKFRKGRFAATADVEQMFFNFEVNPEHRDYLRFLWFEDNNIERPLKEYRMRVHVFGNSPSPSVATFGLRKAVCDHVETDCDDVCHFVRENFYVDDALVSADDTKEIVNLIKSTQDRLQEGGKIRLHKIVSNSGAILSSFSPKDLAEGVTEMNFDTESTFLQKSLGLTWDVIKDVFTYRLSLDEKPYTKRGLLSVINGIFDPLGFAAPVILGGRLILRQAIQNNFLNWDDPLPPELLSDWQEWKTALKELENLDISRPYTNLRFSETQCELHVFADASKDAIAAVAYIRVFEKDHSSRLGFVMGKSKLAPNHGHTIPRLELCAALLATELAIFIQRQLKLSPSQTHFYTDSQVVLGYLCNETRRFYVYVSNRVDRILKASTKHQWHYISTDLNPADCGTRPLNSNRLSISSWLKGPESLTNSPEFTPNSFAIIEPEKDKEVIPLVQVRKTVVSSSLGVTRFERFSSWNRLVNAISFLKQRLARCYTRKHFTIDNRSEVEFIKESELLVIREVQAVIYKHEIDSLRFEKTLQKNSSIIDLSPIMDSNETLRVGGRLRKAKLEIAEKMPIIIPGKSHIAMLIVRHCHNLVHHQGRHITEGSIRSNGFWITGGKRLINSVLHKCVMCKRLRGKAGQQKMSDLPTDRITPTPPFTCVSVDCFGPWNIVSRRTRGGLAQAKRWAVIFSCLATRAIHIEVLEEMSTSCFINAMRRFVALRGPVSEFRSDHGTNFIGTVNTLKIQAINVQDPPVSDFLLKNRIVWRFSPPYASHMNGAVERMIGLSRRILDSMLTENKAKHLTHEVLSTLMAEVCCIVNSRPLASVSNDPTSPTILTPNTLLTQKFNNSDIDSEILKQFEELSVKDMYKVQWKHVQVLSNQFWKRWTCHYLQNLQRRKKWPTEVRNLKEGDVVLMIDEGVSRNQWPMGIIDDVYPSETDGLVRKVSVRVIRDGKVMNYIRPISKIVYLLSD